ncbi:MAG: hypothetical protein J6T67_03825 [Paludibacteraceae bacterium]|nr:hypothetical protein [Paludibacteraceae bacterium]
MGQTYFASDAPDVNLVAEMHLDGNVYELERFSTDFTQGISEINLEPKTEVRGGTMVVSLARVPDNSLLQWAASKWVRKSGEIVFKNETSTPPLKIQFENAACINFTQNCGEGVGSYISLTITAEKMNLNGTPFEHEWEE